MNPNLINRINELAKKAKEEGLTEQEKLEQKQLREEYLHEIRSQFKRELLNVRVFDEEGNDVTPKKIKDERDKQCLDPKEDTPLQ